MIIAVVVGIIIIALLVYGVSFLSPPLDAGVVRILQAAIVILGAVLIAQRAGLF